MFIANENTLTEEEYRVVRETTEVFYFLQEALYEAHNFANGNLYGGVLNGYDRTDEPVCFTTNVKTLLDVSQL